MTKIINDFGAKIQILYEILRQRQKLRLDFTIATLNIFCMKIQIRHFFQIHYIFNVFGFSRQKIMHNFGYFFAQKFLKLLYFSFNVKIQMGFFLYIFKHCALLL